MLLLIAVWVFVARRMSQGLSGATGTLGRRAHHRIAGITRLSKDLDEA